MSLSFSGGKKRKSLNPDVPDEEPVEEARKAETSKQEEPSSTSEKRKRVTRRGIQTPERPAKRTRETRHSEPTESLPPVSEGLTTRSKANTLSARKPKKEDPPRVQSPEIVPDSEEDAPTLKLPPDYVSPAKSSRNKRKARASPSQKQPVPAIIDVDSNDEDSAPPETGRVVDNETLGDETPVEATIPAHRARLANPRVKMVNEAEFGAMDGGIASKIRAFERRAAGPESPKANSPPKKKKRSKPGPGRSSAGHISLLTADTEGGLQTIKMKPKRTVAASPSPEPISREEDAGIVILDDDEPKEQPPPPTSEELLQLAGLDTEDAEALSDFEDAPEEGVAPANGRVNIPDTIDNSSSRNERFALAVPQWRWLKNLLVFQS